MPEVATFLTHQPLAFQIALYAGSLLALVLAGSLSFARLLATFGAAGETLAANRTWQALAGSSCKHDALLTLGVLLYAAVLLALEPAVRVASSQLGNVIVTTWMLAPIAGAITRRA